MRKNMSSWANIFIKISFWSLKSTNKHSDSPQTRANINLTVLKQNFKFSGVFCSKIYVGFVNLGWFLKIIWSRLVFNDFGLNDGFYVLRDDDLGIKMYLYIQENCFGIILIDLYLSDNDILTTEDQLSTFLR